MLLTPLHSKFCFVIFNSYVFSSFNKFRHLINDIYWKLCLFIPCQKQSEFDAACCITVIYIHSMLLALTEGNQSMESFRGSPSQV